MFIEYSSLSDEELDLKMEEVMKKMSIASSIGNEYAVQALNDQLELMNMELFERAEKERFNIINGRTPESLVIGEDEDEPDASTDKNQHRKPRSND